MILIDYHLLAILPTLLFTLGVVVRYLSQSNLENLNLGEEDREKVREQYYFDLNMESIVLSVINGLILGMLSGSFSAGVAYLLFGVILGIMVTSLQRNGKEDLAEYIMVVAALLFFYEFIYFLVAGTYFILFGAVIIGWQIATIWFFGIIGGAIGGFILFLILRARLSGDEDQE